MGTTSVGIVAARRRKKYQKRANEGGLSERTVLVDLAVGWREVVSLGDVYCRESYILRAVIHLVKGEFWDRGPYGGGIPRKRRRWRR